MTTAIDTFINKGEEVIWKPSPRPGFSPISIKPRGPRDAKVVVVGDWPHSGDERLGQLFADNAGMELGKMLNEANLNPEDIYYTTVLKNRPIGEQSEWGIWENSTPKKRGNRPSLWLLSRIDELQAELSFLSPNVIICLGDLASYALTWELSSHVWRGSQMVYKPLLAERPVNVLITYAPQQVQAKWEWRPLLVQDLKRAKGMADSPEIPEPAYSFMLRPSYSDAISVLEKLIRDAEKGLWLSVDIETRRGQITCLALAWSDLEAICLPFTCLEREEGYWLTSEEEVQIILKLRELLTHPNCQVIGQNFAYDAQYFYARFGFIPNLVDDTMTLQHVAFAGMQKSLAFLSSLYCTHHRYWKDDGSEWKPADGEEKYWTYNCTDAVKTFEAAATLRGVIKQLHLEPAYAKSSRLWHSALKTMLRGIRVDLKARESLASELLLADQEREQFIANVVGYPLNPKSPKQMQKFLYTEMGLPIIKKRGAKGKPGSITANFEALVTLCAKEPLLIPIANAVLDRRSLGTYLATFVNAKLSSDKRMRSSYNINGTETFRLSSSEDAFDTGANLQNIPSGSKQKTSMKLPNIRKLYIPDPGCTMFDIDLDRADLQVVVWEADDGDLKKVLRDGIDMHCYSACDIYDIKGIPIEELAETHPNYPEHRGRIGEARRQKTKAGVHATNYFVQAPTLAKTLGCSIREADAFIKRWLEAHPGIDRWQQRTRRQLETTRTVVNAFGFRRLYLGRIEHALPEALAWTPQCVPTTCEVLTKGGWVAIANIKEADAIATWDTNYNIKFEVPKAWHFGTTTLLYNLEGLGYSATEEHKLPYFNAGRTTLQTTTVLQLPEHARIPRVGKYSGSSNISIEWLTFLAAFQADGHYDKQREAITFEFQKTRKMDRLEKTLIDLDIHYTKSVVRRGATTFYLRKGHGLLPLHKYWGCWLLDFTAEALDFLLQEIEFWDGWRDPNGTLWFSSSHKKNCEWIATIAALRGLRARWMSPDLRADRPNYRLTIAPNKGKHSTCTPQKRSVPETAIACPTVSTGFFLLRNGQEISITGNSTVANIINEAWCEIDEKIKEVQILMQVHDSLVGQYPSHKEADLLPLIKMYARVVVPYEDPLIIPVGLKTSQVSWGDCKGKKW